MASAWSRPSYDGARPRDVRHPYTEQARRRRHWADRRRGQGASAVKLFTERALIWLLKAFADGQTLSHQPSKAARYVLLSRHAARAEIMFERKLDSPPNIWCHENAAGTVLIAAQRPRHSPSGALWIKRGAEGEFLYGRHSALQNLPQLDEADLVCFTPASVTEIGEIIDRLRNVTVAELS